MAISTGAVRVRPAPVVFVSEPNSHLNCPVCGDLYRQPVINTVCGHTMCNRCLQTCGRCPLDNESCDTSKSVVNKLVVSQIEDLEIFCRFGLIKSSHGNEFFPDPCGCKEKIILGKREEHETVCTFATVSCPNSDHCGKFRRSELDLHLESCMYTGCDHAPKGCEFVGTKSQVSDHLDTCGYRCLLKSVSHDEFSSTTSVLEDSNRVLRSQVGALTSRVIALEATNSIMQSQLRTYQNSLESLALKFEALQTLLEVRFSKTKRSSGSGMSSPDSRRWSDSRRSLSGSPTNSVKFEKWEMPFQFKCIGTFRGHKDMVWCLSTFKHRLFSAGSDCLIKIWDLEVLSKGCIQTVSGHSAPIHCMLVVGNLLCTAGDDRSIRLWDIGTWQEKLHIPNAHDDIVCAMVSNEEYLFTSSFSIVKVWTTKNITLKHTISGFQHWVRTLALSSDGGTLYSGSKNAIDIWETNDQFKSLGKIDHEFRSIYSLVLTDKYIISGTCDHLITIFDVSTKKHVIDLIGHTSTIQCLVVSPSGRFLFSGSADSTIQVWNLENMLPIHALRRHEGSVNTLALHGDILLSGSEDREIKIFKHFQMQMGFAAKG